MKTGRVILLAAIYVVGCGGNRTYKITAEKRAANWVVWMIVVMFPLLIVILLFIKQGP